MRWEFSAKKQEQWETLLIGHRLEAAEDKDRNDLKFFQSGIGTPWTKFLESPLLPLLRLASLGSGVLTCGLLFGLLISNLWWCILNSCIILVLIVEIFRRWRQPIYNGTKLVLASVAELFQHIYQSVCQLCIWIQQKFQSVCFEASQAFSLTHDAVEQENGRTRVANV